MLFDKMLALTAIILSAVSIIYTMMYNRSSGAKAQREEIEKLKADVLILKTQIAVFWRAIEEGAMKMFHHPDDPYRMDNLIDKYRAGTITDREIDKLAGRLKRIRDSSETTPGESAMAALWLGIIRSKQKEKEIAKSSGHNY